MFRYPPLDVFICLFVCLCLSFCLHTHIGNSTRIHIYIYVTYRLQNTFEHIPLPLHIQKRIYVYRCKYLYICIRECNTRCVYVCRVYICACAHLYRHIHMYMGMCSSVCICIYTYVHTYICVFSFLHIYSFYIAYLYLYVHVHMLVVYDEHEEPPSGCQLYSFSARKTLHEQPQTRGTPCHCGCCKHYPSTGPWPESLPIS